MELHSIHKQFRHVTSSALFLPLVHSAFCFLSKPLGCSAKEPFLSLLIRVALYLESFCLSYFLVDIVTTSTRLRQHHLRVETPSYDA